MGILTKVVHEVKGYMMPFRVKDDILLLQLLPKFVTLSNYFEN